MVFASPATLVPPEAPDLPEEAKPEEEKDDSVVREDPMTRAKSTNGACYNKPWVSPE
jgi:hypothetical protein